jgi:hypothetical protein
MLKQFNHLPSPKGMSREQIMDLLMREEYGYLPEAPESVEIVSENISWGNDRFCANKAQLLELVMQCNFKDGRTFSFPFTYMRPKNPDHKYPCFVHMNFDRAVPNKYQPAEEILDNGFALMSFNLRDITCDTSNDFTDGLCGVVFPNGRNNDTDAGKLILWSWTAMRVMDYIQTLDELDHDEIYVVGHSRLGKAALIAGALDTRFACAISNNSGCGGAAIARDNTGETVEAITRVFPQWFCKNYFNYVDKEDTMPFDQHFLLAALAGRRVYVASAVEDLWACPENEYMSCVLASEYFEENGQVGFVHPDRMPVVGDSFHEGNIGYHLRSGTHYLSRYDWNEYFKFVKKGKK